MLKKAALVLCLAISIASPARAQAVVPASAPYMGPYIAVSIWPFALATFGSIGVMYLIADGVDPWTPLFPVVEHSYPEAVHRDGV